MPSRRLSILASFLLVTSLLALVPAQAQSSKAARGPAQREVGVLGGGNAGTGVLPNFEATGPNVIRLLAGAFDPVRDRPPAPAGFSRVAEGALAPGTAQYWLAQVESFRFPEATRAVERAGGSIVGVVPDATYMVRATPAQRDRIASSPAVRWVGYYQPAWRVPVAAGGRQALIELKGSQTYRVYAFRQDPDPSAVGTALAGIPGVTVVRNAGSVYEVRATAAQVPAMAAIPAVQWIGIRPTGVLHNANARWVNDTGVRDVYAATAPGRLTGAGQTAAVADTGVNYTYDLNHRAHVSFSDCDPSGVCKEAIYTQAQAGSDPENIDNVVNNNTGHRKMVAYFDLGATGPNMFDDSSHGSHTAGSVDGDQPPYDTWTGDDGLAPAANHVHQNIADSGGGLGGLPADDYDLWRQAYRPRNPAGVSETSGAGGNPADYSTDYFPTEDARTHNNSYGLIAPVIDEGSAVALDQFVWDHEDMTIVVSAGNAGPDPGSIGSPSVAKNNLSSGASANGRQPMVSIDSMAVFSSHGPTGDGRLGPDLATPGQIVVSVKGGTTADHHTAQGTSMSGPILTGLATLVRQYFWDGYGPSGGDGFAGGAPSPARQHNPSAALVRAALVNGAVRMRGWYTGDDGTQRATDGQWPSAGQGFGRVSLNDSLYFADDPTNNWYTDVYRGDTTNPNPNLRPFRVSATPATRTFQVKVASGQPLDVTLAWTDAPDLLPAGTPALINNLDLTVTDPTGTTYVGNNMNSRVNPGVAVAETLAGPGPSDQTNLTERVRIAAPAAGTYTITVGAEPIIDGNQGFALAAGGLVSAVSGSFNPGPPLQVDQAGSPVIANVSVVPASADTARITFDTNEPTSATATLTDDGNTVTFVDSYNLGAGPLPGAPPGDTGYYGLADAAVETSADYANRPVVGTKHEILLTGLNPGATYPITLSATDLANNQVSQGVSHSSLGEVFQPDSVDIAQCSAASPPSPSQCQWNTGTQMYASGGSLLGAFMFRVPQGAVDPNAITGAAVEMVSSHNWVVPYTQDPQLSVDLLDESVEATWGLPIHNYETIAQAPADARAYPETTHKIGAYQRYAFTFRCGDLQALKDTLGTVQGGNRQAAFRYDSSDGGLFAVDFGFNRRSRGADLRPRLVLFTNDANPYGDACDPNTPAPTVTDVGIHDGLAANSVTVSWRTDVRSDSFVLFREQGSQDWIQVGTLARSTRVHHVQVFGLDSSKEYEFVVRSSACNGATSTDTNSGAGYDFFRDPPPDIPTIDYWLHGLPDDQAVKQTRLFGEPPPEENLTFSQTEPAATDPPVAQTTTGIANESFIGNPLTAFWTGPFSGQITGDVQFSWYWSSADPVDATVSVSLFADPDWASDNPVQGQRIIGHGLINLKDLTAAPSLQTGSIPVDGTVQEELLVQVASSDLTEEDLTVHYNSTVTPSKFGVPTEPTPPSEPLPLTGPVPPPSAGATGLTPPPTRSGPASAADIAAGTGACDIPGADLSVTKTDSPDPVLAGDQITYTVTVTNNGPSAATGVVLTDAVPAGTTFVSASASQGSCSESGGTVSCSVGGLAKNGTATATIVVDTSSEGTVTNTASASANESDPNPGDNSATATTTVSPAADLSVTKTDSPDPVKTGQPLTYTIVVTNNGPSTASSVRASDTLHRSVGFIAVTTTQGSCSTKKNVVMCALGSLGSASSATIRITVKPNKKGTITNTVTVSASTPDSNQTNNSATAITTVT